MAQSGAEALDLLLAAPYHLMLLDIKMPGMDGVEVLEHAKALAPELTVIMITPYATVETAVEAMKIGALDYLVKPFDMEALMPKVAQAYQRLETAEARQIEAGAVVLAGGTDFCDPSIGKNTFGYGVSPRILTQIEFERLLSGTGPTAGRLVRLSDGLPVRKIAWLQCVGSRDVQLEADFCSSFCCMASIKEAVLAKEQSEGELETAIFFMDMRTFGKTFQRYRDQAEGRYGVRLRNTHGRIRLCPTRRAAAWQSGGRTSPALAATSLSTWWCWRPGSGRPPGPLSWPAAWICRSTLHGASSRSRSR